MSRNLIDLLSKLLAWLKRNQRIYPLPNPVLVNIGSSLWVTEGWINIDSSLNVFCADWPRFLLRILYRLTNIKNWFSLNEYLDILTKHKFVFHKVEYGLPFDNESIDYLYSSHLLEHLYKDDAVELLQEAYRVLKEGAIFRICVPDLAYAISLYQDGLKEQALRHFFPASKIGYFDNHRYLYDFELLKDLLLRQGFKTVERCKYKKGKTPNIDILDNRPDETLFIEAKK